MKTLKSVSLPNCENMYKNENDDDDACNDFENSKDDKDDHDKNELESETVELMFMDRLLVKI